MGEKDLKGREGGKWKGEAPTQDFQKSPQVPPDANAYLQCMFDF